jgi:hypothetical protein
LLAIIAALLALVVCLLVFRELQDRLRMWGLALQLIGLLMVGVGMLETRDRFGVGLAAVARTLLSRRPKPAPTADRTAALAGSAVDTSQGQLTPVLYNSTEGHVAAVEDALNKVRAEAGAAVRKEAASAPQRWKPNGSHARRTIKRLSNGCATKF